MKNIKPLFDSATHYRIEVQGQVDVTWLQNFDRSAAVTFRETGPAGETTVLDMHTDQSGIVGLLRKMHAAGMVILKVKIIPDLGNGGET